MIVWIRKINWRLVLFSGFLYTIVATLMHQIEAFLMMDFYTKPEYYGVWSKLMMPSAGPPPLDFFLVSFVITFVTGVSLAVIYYYVRDLLPKKFWLRVTFFADLMVATSFVFWTLPVYLLFNVPTQLVISWFFTGFITILAGSFIFLKIIK